DGRERRQDEDWIGVLEFQDDLLDVMPPRKVELILCPSGLFPVRSQYHREYQAGLDVLRDFLREVFVEPASAALVVPERYVVPPEKPPEAVGIFLVHARIAQKQLARDIASLLGLRLGRSKLAQPNRQVLRKVGRRLEEDVLLWHVTQQLLL